MKNSLLAILFLFLGYGSYAQGAYKTGTNQFTIGVGLGSYSNNHNMSIPPLRLSYDIGFHEFLSIEPFLQYSAWKDDWNYQFDKGWEKQSYLDIGARLNVHWGSFIDGLPSELDLYSGLWLAYQSRSYRYFRENYNDKDGWHVNNDDDYGSSTSHTGLGLSLAGCRWYFSGNTGLLAELGWSSHYSSLLVGLSFKM